MNEENKHEYHHSGSEWEHEYLKQLGERLRHVRDEIAHCTQDEFGKRLNTGRSSVVRYEKGERACDAVYLRMVCETWGVSPEWIQDGVGEPLSNAGARESISTYGDDYESILDDVYQAVLELESVLKNKGLTIDDPENKAKLVAMCVDYLHKRADDSVEPATAQILRFIKFGT